MLGAPLTANPTPSQLKYSQLIHGLAAENIVINRKALSLLAENEPQTFKARTLPRQHAHAPLRTAAHGCLSHFPHELLVT